MDWENFRFIDLFAGIGGIRLGFESAGGKCVYSSEWDKYSQITYEANFGEKPDGDITKVDVNEIVTKSIESNRNHGLSLETGTISSGGKTSQNIQ